MVGLDRSDIPLLVVALILAASIVVGSVFLLMSGPSLRQGELLDGISQGIDPERTLGPRDQWYLRVKVAAGPDIHAVSSVLATEGVSVCIREYVDSASGEVLEYRVESLGTCNRTTGQAGPIGRRITPNRLLQLTLAVASRLATPSRLSTASAAERWC